MLALMTRMSRSWTRRRTRVPAWGRPMPMWWRRPLVAEGDEPGGVDAVGADAVVGVGGAVAGAGFRAGGVGGGRGHAAGEGAVRALVVVDAGEGVQQGLEVGEGGGLDGLGAEPVLHGLLESFDFPLGLGVVRLAVLLLYAEAAQLVLEGVAAASAAGQAGGEDHAVVGQGGGRDAVLLAGSAEGEQHGGAGDPGVRGKRERVAGVVIEPGQDLGIRLAGERVVGEVGLPALVGHARPRTGCRTTSAAWQGSGVTSPAWPGSG